MSLTKRALAGLRRCRVRAASRDMVTPAAHAVLRRHRIARVAVDPPKGSTRCAAGGWNGVIYYRLHASPRMCFSPYDQPFLTAIAARVREYEAAVWGMFDNTGLGAAFENAVRMRDLLGVAPPNARAVSDTSKVR